ncbi:MAG: DUF4382 domain-containing protein [Thermoplasmataceae archaeon]
MISKKIIAAVIIIIVIASGLLYYEYGYNSGGKLNISVADTAGPGVSAVFLTFTGIEVHSTGGNNSSGWQTFHISSTTINIYHVSITNASFLSSLNLSAGKYTQVKLELSKVVATINGINVSMTLSTPFALIIHPFTISAHSTTTMNIDFVLNASSMITSSMFTPVVGTVQVS